MRFQSTWVPEVDPLHGNIKYWQANGSQHPISGFPIFVLFHLLILIQGFATKSSPDELRVANRWSDCEHNVSQWYNTQTEVENAAQTTDSKPKPNRQCCGSKSVIPIQLCLPYALCHPQKARTWYRIDQSRDEYVSRRSHLYHKENRWSISFQTKKLAMGGQLQPTWTKYPRIYPPICLNGLYRVMPELWGYFPWSTSTVYRTATSNWHNFTTTGSYS